MHPNISCASIQVPNLFKGFSGAKQDVSNKNGMMIAKNFALKKYGVHDRAMLVENAAIVTADNTLAVN